MQTNSSKTNDELIARKFQRIVDEYIGSLTAIRDAFGYDGVKQLSAFTKPYNPSVLKKVHMEALERHFNIPIEVFDVNKPLGAIDATIQEYRNNVYLSEVFRESDENLMKSIKGVLYAHSYASKASHKPMGVHVIKTTIYENHRVVDQAGNTGILKIGKEQSCIIKESKNAKSLTIIRFDNYQALYGNFRFLIFSNQNGKRDEEMVNYGFYSRKAYRPDEAKAILGDIDKVQLKLDKEFATRVNDS
jgi:hypothetical protein